MELYSPIAESGKDVRQLLSPNHFEKNKRRQDQLNMQSRLKTSSHLGFVEST